MSGSKSRQSHLATGRSGERGIAQIARSPKRVEIALHFKEILNDYGRSLARVGDLGDFRMSQCPKCFRSLVVAICICGIAVESAPITREHIPVPDRSRVADQPPHTPHRDAPPTRRMITVAVSTTAGATIGTNPSIRWTAPPLDDFDPPAT